MIRSRLAPTPSGYLHWGNIFNFALTWALVRRESGVLALRIDDLDATRARPEFVADIFETLRWLGFDWDEGPKHEADFKEHFSQGLRLSEYRNALQFFTGYACDCSRQSVKLKPCDCQGRHLELKAHVTQWKEATTGVVLWRKDDLPAYHLVSVLEDVRTHTNLIVRGEDLRESSETQLQLAKLLGPVAESFTSARFVHHQLIQENGGKLSKSAGSPSIKHWRGQGLTPSEIWSELGQKVGQRWRKLADVDPRAFTF